MAGPCWGPGPAAVGGVSGAAASVGAGGVVSSGPDVGSEVSFICIYLPHRRRFEARRQERRTTSRLPFDASGLRTPSTLYMKIVNSPGPGPIGPGSEPDSGPWRSGAADGAGPLRPTGARRRMSIARDPLDGPSSGPRQKRAGRRQNAITGCYPGRALPILGPDGRRIRASDTGTARDTRPVVPRFPGGRGVGSTASTRPVPGTQTLGRPGAQLMGALPPSAITVTPVT